MTKRILTKRAGVNDFKLNFTEEEFGKLEEGMKEFRKSFGVDFSRIKLDLGSER